MSLIFYYLFLIYSAFIFRTSYCHSNSTNSSGVAYGTIWDFLRRANLQTVNEDENEISDRKWLAQIFQEAESNFDVSPDVSPHCKRDFDRYKTNLKNNTLWALRMFDASEWPIKGLISGDIFHMGNWDECLMVRSHDIKGQYCWIETFFDFQSNVNNSYGQSVFYQPNEESSVWDTLEMYRKNPIRVPRNLLTWPLCMPSSCNEKDLIRSLTHTLEPLFRNNSMNISVNVVPHTCNTQEQPSPLPTSFFLTCALLLLLVLLVFFYGAKDLWNGTDGESCPGANKSWRQNLSDDLSFVRNYMKWTDTTRDANLRGGHIFKIIYMWIIIYGHRGMYTARVPSFNTEKAENLYPYSIKVTNLTVVDVFFFFSGYLLFHYGYKAVKKVGGIYVVVSCLCRWVRMVPVLCLIHLFIIYVLPYLGSGPLWNAKCHLEMENCKTSLWANFLAVGNIFSVEKQCLLISWYVSVDVQLHIIGSILLYTMSKNKIFGLCLTVFTIATSMVVTFSVALLRQYHGLLQNYLVLMHEPRMFEEFNIFYISAYPRLVPYLFGMLTACVVSILKKKNYQFSMIQRWILIISTALIKVAVMCYGMRFYEIDRAFDGQENALYAAVHRLLYILFDACYTTIDMTTDLGFVGRLTNWKGYMVIARISYSVFIINTLIQFYHASSQKTNIDGTSNINHFTWVMSDIGWTYIVGIFVYLFFETPIYNVGKRLIQYLFRLLWRVMISREKHQTNFDTIQDGEVVRELDNEKYCGTHHGGDSGVNSGVNSESPDINHKTLS